MNIAVSNVYQKMGFFPGAHGIPDISRLEDDENSRNIELPYSKMCIRDSYNPSSTIAALRSVLQTYGRKPDMLARIPEIPLRIVDGKEMIAPAQALSLIHI